MPDNVSGRNSSRAFGNSRIAFFVGIRLRRLGIQEVRPCRNSHCACRNSSVGHLGMQFGWYANLGIQKAPSGIQAVHPFRNTNGAPNQEFKLCTWEFKVCVCSGTQVGHLRIQVVRPCRNSHGTLRKLSGAVRNSCGARS